VTASNNKTMFVFRFWLHWSNVVGLTVNFKILFLKA
jgi:hypothetical protein